LVAKTGSITKDEMKDMPEYQYIIADEEAPFEQVKLATFKIDFHKITAELVNQAPSVPFCYSTRRARTVILHRHCPDHPDTSVLVLDTLHQPLFAHSKRTTELYNSINDDYFIVQNIADESNKMYVSYGDGSGDMPQFDGLNVAGNEGCDLQRPRSSERDPS
jgi:hypothetical protein